MIREADAIRQLLRFSVLRGFPGDGTKAQLELLRCIRDAAENPGHCSRIVDAWLRDEQFSPTPADLYRVAHTVPVVEMTERADRSCRGCNGTGWEHVWRLTTYATTDSYCHRSTQLLSDEQAVKLQKQVDGRTQRVDSCARRCTQCSYGKAFSEVDA